MNCLACGRDNVIGESAVTQRRNLALLSGSALPGCVCSHAQRRNTTSLPRQRLLHGVWFSNRARYSRLESTSGESSSYVARYLPSPGGTSATQRRAERKPGMARRSAMCSSSYQALNSSSIAGGGSVIVSSRPVSYTHLTL